MLVLSGMCSNGPAEATFGVKTKPVVDSLYLKWSRLQACVGDVPSLSTAGRSSGFTGMLGARLGKSCQ